MNARLPPLRPGFDSHTCHLTWVYFIVSFQLPPSTKTDTSLFKFDADVRASIDISPRDRRHYLAYLLMMIMIIIIIYYL